VTFDLEHNLNVGEPLQHHVSFLMIWPFFWEE